MLHWYSGMASKNMHAVEEAAAGNTYTKAEFWGLLGGEKQDATLPPKVATAA